MAGWIGAAFLALGIVYVGASAALAGRRHKSLLLVKTITATVFTGVGAICAGIAYLQFSAGLPFNTFYKARSVATLSIPPLLRICFEMRGRPKTGRAVEAALFLAWSALVVVTVGSNWLDPGAASLLPYVDKVSPYEQNLRVVLTLTLLWALVEQYRTYRATVGLQRRQMAYFFTGVAIYAFGAMSLSATAVLLGAGRADPAMSLLFSIPWIALTLYSATRYRLFEVGFLLSRTLAGLAVVAACTVAGLGVHRALLPHLATSYATVVTCALVAALLVASGGFRERLQQRLILALGYRDPSAGTQSPLVGVDTTELADRLVNNVHAHLAPQTVAFFQRRPQGGHALAHATGLPDDAPNKVDEQAAVARWLRKTEGPFILEEQQLFGQTQLVDAVREELAPIDVAVIAPISTDGRLEGMLVLGPKPDHEVYNRDELDWLITLCTRAALAVENTRLYADLDNAVKDLDAFVRSAAHDLRTPLRAIDNLAAFATEDIANAPEAVPEHLSGIRTRARRMESLLDGIERYLRARPDPHTPAQPIALKPLMEKIVERRISATFNVDLKIDDGEIRTLAAPFEAVLDELVDNAQRHHDRTDGHIDITATVDDGVLEVTVTDDGPGIPAAYQHKIWRLFQTLERRDVTESSGIGLAMCRRVVTHMGGTLDLATVERGTEFRLRWPLDES